MKDKRAFLDTNVLIYALAKDDPRRDRAEALLTSAGVISVQTLNEFVAVAVRKLAMPWADVLLALSAFRQIFPAPVPVTVEVHQSALEIVERYGYHIYDSLIIAAALQAGCRTLYTEDIKDGQTIGDMTIRNPWNQGGF
jgi:predicted nucleic acid-binding protein